MPLREEFITKRRACQALQGHVGSTRFVGVRKEQKPRPELSLRFLEERGAGQKKTG